MDEVISQTMTSKVADIFLLNQQKAIALLQTEADALDLRPENKLSLFFANMSNGHSDLLTIDELPIKPWALGSRIKGLALVDHNYPRFMWRNSTILSIVDHHEDSGISKHANPRIIKAAACCSSLVAELVLDALDERERKAQKERKKKKQNRGKKNKKGIHNLESSTSLELEIESATRYEKHGGELPTELVDLLLRAIAIDSSGLKSTQPVDSQSAHRLFKLSSWAQEENPKNIYSVMKGLNRELTYYKKALDDLTLRDLLRRDWKSDSLVPLFLFFRSFRKNPRRYTDYFLKLFRNC